MVGLTKKILRMTLARIFRFIAAIFDENISSVAVWSMRISANLGDAWAQNNLAVKYLEGVEVEKNFELAAELLTSSAAQRQVEAYMNLGWMYYAGEFFDQDFQQSAHWYEKAASKGNAVAKYNLGLMYCDGLGVPEDYDAGMKLIVEASASGLAQAIEVVARVNASENSQGMY